MLTGLPILIGNDVIRIILVLLDRDFKAPLVEHALPDTVPDQLNEVLGTTILSFVLNNNVASMRFIRRVLVGWF